MGYKYAIDANGKVNYETLPIIQSDGTISNIGLLDSVASAAASGLLTLAGIHIDRTGVNFVLKLIAANPYVQSVAGELIVQSIDVSAKYINDEQVEFTASDGLRSVTNIVLGTELGIALNGAALALAGLETLPLWGYVALAASGALLLSGSMFAGEQLAAVLTNAAFGFQALDARFFDQNGNHVGGVLLPDGLQGAPESSIVQQFIAESGNEILGGGSIQTYRALAEDTGVSNLPLGTEYEIYDGSFLVKVADLLPNMYNAQSQVVPQEFLQPYC